MSIDINEHPELFPGAISDFGFHKIERQVKATIKHILETFFSSQFQLYKIMMPELVEVQNTATITKTFIERDFPFFERKLPLIAIASKNKKELKPFLGTDDFLYQDLVQTSSGLISSVNMYANMYHIPVELILATTSPEARMQLQELVNICFSHYFRWSYMYKGEDGSYFNVVPSITPIVITGENEVADKSATTLIYTTSLQFTSYIEYIFPDIGDNYLQFITEGFKYSDIATSTGGLETILVPIYVYSSTGYITSTGYYTSTGFIGTDYRWWLTELDQEEVEPPRNPIYSFTTST